MLSGWLQKEFCHLQIRLFSTEQSVQILSGQSPAHSWEVLGTFGPSPPAGGHAAGRGGATLFALS